jgi:signal transduction histidine kinase
VWRSSHLPECRCSSVMSESELEGGVRSRAAILLLGLALTAVSVISLGTLRADQLSGELSGAGSELMDRTSEAVDAVMNHARSLSALREASVELSEDELQRFARALGPGRSVTQMGYRSADFAESLDHTYRESQLSPDDVLAGYELDPVLAEFSWSKQPAYLGPIAGTSSVLVVGPVFEPSSPSRVAGFVYVIADLGYLVQFPGGELRLEFRDTGKGDISDGAISTQQLWRTNDQLAGRSTTFEVERTGAARLDVALLVVALFGAIGSILAASRIGLRDQKISTEMALRALKQSTADKDRFMASVSHELRTPLTSVVGLASILEVSWQEMEEAEVQKMIGDIHHEGRELADLVEDLLTIGRVESGVLTYRPSTISLDQEVNRVVERIITPPHVRIVVEEGLGLADADALRTRQIVRNLLANAVRHATSVIEVRRISGDQVGVQVANDGPGIPSSQAERLFQAYQAGLRVGQPGSIGLGLYVSRQLARGMGGELSFVPHTDEARFELSLPPASGTDTEIVDGTEPAGSAVGSGHP